MVPPTSCNFGWASVCPDSFPSSTGQRQAPFSQQDKVINPDRAPLLAQKSGKAAEFEELLWEIESSKLEEGALDAACTKLHKLVEGLRLPASVLKKACERQPLLFSLADIFHEHTTDIAGAAQHLLSCQPGRRHLPNNLCAGQCPLWYMPHRDQQRRLC